MKSLLNPSKKFKIETNAKQLHMTGVIILHKLINVIVVEGGSFEYPYNDRFISGPKQQKFYNNLMMNRIKWEDEIIGQKKDADKEAPGERNQCQLVKFMFNVVILFFFRYGKGKLRSVVSAIYLS